MKKNIISTNNAPAAIGIYSQAVAVNGGVTIYLSGQIPLVPETMEVVEGGIEEQIHQVFKNLTAMCEASKGTVSDIVIEPYPARAAIGVSALPKGVGVEMDGIMIINSDSYSF